MNLSGLILQACVAGALLTSSILPVIAVAADGPKPITFNDIKFEMKKEEPFARSMLTPKIEALGGKTVKVQGWILPNSAYQLKGLKWFVLVRDNKECCFGPEAALCDSIWVDMDPGTTANFTSLAISVEGVLTIREYKDNGVVRCIYHLQAVKAK